MAEKTGFCAFWLQCLKWAYWKWEGREPIIAYGIPAINALLAIIGVTGVVGGIKLNDLWWVAVLPVLIMLILVAPYRVWKKAKVELLELTTYKLSVEIEPQTGDPKDREIWRHLRVTNPSAQPISDCYGLLRSFRAEDTIDQNKCPPPGFYYPWSSYGGRGKRAKIGGTGGFDKLDIAVFNYHEEKYKHKLWTPELSEDEYNRQMIYPLPKGTYYVEIQIGSTAIAFQPVNIELKLVFDGGANLNIKELNNTSKA